MAKSSVLDEAIAAVAPPPPTSKIDRILAELADRDDFDRLLDILNSSWRQWPHTQTAGILRHLCDHYGVDHESVSDKNVGEWRQVQAQL